MPVFRLLGGYRDRIPCYKSGGDLETVEEYVADAVKAKEEGFFGYKDHCYRGVETMKRVAAAVREAVEPDFLLMHDAVQTYDYVDAIRVGRALQEADYYWFEEPLRDYDMMGLKQLSDALDLPIAASEYLPGTIYSTSQLVAQQAVDIVRASVPWRGGITDMIKIARLAEAFGVNCEITSVGGHERIRARPRHRGHPQLHLLRRLGIGKPRGGAADHEPDHFGGRPYQRPSRARTRG